MIWPLPLADLVDGMAFSERMLPASRDRSVSIDVDGLGTKQWQLCAVAAYAIYKVFTEDVETGGTTE